jgi:hypothetical protein
VTTPLNIEARPAIRGGLASVAGQLPSGTDWRNGVEITTTPDDGVFTWDTCEGEAYDISGTPIVGDKPVSSVGAGLKFFPVTAEKIVECGPGATRTTIGDIARETARGSLDRQIHKVLARALQGIIPTFGDNSQIGASIATLATVPAGFDPDNPGNLAGTLQGLLDSVCDCSSSDPVFHVPRAWMPQFIAQDLVTWNEALGVFMHGPHEVSFDCYVNEDPTGTYETLTDGSEVWIFATAKPMIEISEADDVTVLTHRQNNYKAMVERQAIIAFDPTCVIMAKARV